MHVDFLLILSKHQDIHDNIVIELDNVDIIEHIYMYKARYEESSGGCKGPLYEPEENIHNKESLKAY